MFLGLLLVYMVLGANGEKSIGDNVIDIRDSVLISVTSTARSSEQLNLSGLGIRRIQRDAFVNQTNIKILNLANNSIGDLTSSPFWILRNLEHLSLADNAISDFTGAFVGLQNLKTLNISNNPCMVLGPGALRGLSKSIDIIVQGNSLKAIYTNVFDQGNSLMPMLTDVFLQRNLLNAVFPEFFDPNSPLLRTFSSFTDLAVALWNIFIHLFDLSNPFRRSDMLRLFVALRDIFFINPLLLSRPLTKTFTKKEDRDEEMNDSNYKAPESRQPLESDAEPRWRFKVCLNQGKVTILERVRSNEVLQAGCSLLRDDRFTVYLNNLGIKEFERGWYRLPKDPEITTISFSRNDIVNITSEILNDLPANVRRVNLSDNKIGRLDKGVIKNTYIKWFDLSNNSISEIEESALAGMNVWELHLNGNQLKDTRFLETVAPILNKLSLSGNQLEEFNKDLLVTFHQLEALNLTENRITILRNNSLKRLPALLNLDLSRNRIRTLEPGCFKDLRIMQNLTLRDNEISDLGAGVFQDLSRLENLDLGENRVTRLTEGFGNSLPRDLDTLHLDRNAIGSLENGTFVNVPKRWLNLENNRLTSIAKGSFYGKGLAHERVGASSILVRLLSGNQLAMQMAAAVGLELPTGIGIVNLSGNPVTRLENGALFGLQKRRENYVYVERNSIELIQGGLFDNALR